jgi:hypothetical protein
MNIGNLLFGKGVGRGTLGENPYGSIGINTNQPTAVLDVNGVIDALPYDTLIQEVARLRNLPPSSPTDEIVTADANGFLRKTSLTELRLTGPYYASVTTVTTSYSVGATDYVIIVKTAASVTITLPKASDNAGRVLKIKYPKSLSSGGTPYIAPSTGDTIDGSPSVATGTGGASAGQINFNGAGTAIEFVSGGADNTWYVISTTN